MLHVAVTGTLCSGKTSLCHFLEECGAVYVSADDIVHRLLATKTQVQDKVIALLGEDVLVDGSLNKAAIAAKVFRDERLLKGLEAILHPLVRDEIKRECYAVERSGKAPMFVVEVPLLFEVGAAGEYDLTVTVVADERQSRTWYKTMTGGDETDYERRSSRQLDAEGKADGADYIVVNDGDLNKLKGMAKKLYGRLLNHQV